MRRRRRPNTSSRVRFSRWLGAQKDFTQLFTSLDKGQQEEVKKQFLLSPAMAKNMLEMTCSSTKVDHWFTAQQVAQAEACTSAQDPYPRVGIKAFKTQPHGCRSHNQGVFLPGCGQFKTISTVTTAAKSQGEITDASEAFGGTSTCG